MKKILAFLLISSVAVWANPSLALAGRQTLTVWAMGEEGLRIGVLARKFEKENPDVHVVTQAIPWDAAHEKLLTAVVGGLPPDVCQMGTTWMAEFATLKALEPLEKYIEKSSIVKEENFFKGSWKTAVVENTVCGIPWYVDTRVLFYRKDLLAQVGFSEPPQTWDEFKTACRRLTKESKGDGKPARYGVSLPVRGWGMFLPFVWQNGGDIFHPTSPEVEEALNYYVSFFKEGLTPTGLAADTDMFQAFRTGYFPMFISGPWMVELVHKELPELEGKWGLAVVPGKKRRTSFVGGCNLVIFREAKHKDMAWKFVEYLSRSDVQYQWFKTMKNLPAVKEAWKYPDLRDHPDLKVFGKQLEDTESPPAIPEWEQIAEHIDSRMEAIILNQGILGGDIHKSTKELEDEIQKILNKQKVKKSAAKEFFISFAVISLLIFLVSFFLPANFLRIKKNPEIYVSSNLSRSEVFKIKLSKSFKGYLFIAPSLVILTLFLFIPIFFSFFISMTDWNIYGLADRGSVSFVGFDNYFRVVHDPIFWKSLWNTLLFTGAGVPFTVMISLLCATVLNEKIVRAKSFFRTAYFIPVVSTIVAVAVIWRWLYNPEYGILNYLLKCVHLPTFNWLADPNTALASLILMAAWKNFGYNMIIFLAGLQSIPESLYESARIDGANAWQLFLNITLPGLSTTMVFVVIMSTIGYLQFFAEPYVMTKGGPLNATMSIVLYMYNQGFKFFELGYASALAYILFGVIFLFTLLQIKFRKNGFNVN